MTDENANSDATPPGGSREHCPNPSRARRGGIGRIMAVAVCLSFLVFVYLHLRTAINGGPIAKVAICSGRLKTIGLALDNYHDEYGTFPPAYIASDDGTPMHSWRVLLLPYLHCHNLYMKYRFDEPWNSPHNLQLAEPLDVFKCPSQSDEPSSMTNYLAVIGERTCWPGERSRSKEEITDGLGNTIQLVEVADSGILWSEPRDLHELQWNPQVNASPGQGPSSHHLGAMVLFANGVARFLPDDFSPEELRAYLTVDGGEPLVENETGGLKRLSDARTD